MERGGQSLVQRDLTRNRESEIGVEMVGCNIPVFVDIEKPSISFGLYIMIQDSDACKNVYSIDTTINKGYKGGKLLLHNGHIV
jgi:hypothetical protein